MSYGYKKKVDMSYEAALTRTKEELRKQGFGVLTEIDVKATLKKKLGVDFDNYMIIGAWLPERGPGDGARAAAAVQRHRL